MVVRPVLRLRPVLRTTSLPQTRIAKVLWQPDPSSKAENTDGFKNSLQYECVDYIDV